MPQPDDPKTGTPETTGANQAQIINDALAQPKSYPDDEKRPIVGVEVASQISDPWWSYYTGKILLNPDKTLRQEGLQNTELYEDLLRDAQVRSNLQTRRLAVIGKEWSVEPASEKQRDQKIAEFVKEVLLNFDFDTARYALLQGILTGFKVSEIMWEYSEGDVWIKEMIAKPTRRWSFGLKRELRMLTRHNAFEGDPAPDRKFQTFVMPSDNGSPYGDGLGSTLYWLVWFKKNGIKFWLIFNEKFGSPTAIGKYPVGTNRDQQDALLSALQAIQQESAIKIPDTLQVGLLEAQRSGTMNNYEKFLLFANAEITKAIMGQTLTTEMGQQGGSFAASKIHDEVRADYTKGDADLLSNQLNSQLIRWLVDYNFPDVKKYPKLWIRAQEEKDLLVLAQRDQILQAMGMPISARYVSGSYGIPMIEGDDEVLKPVAGAKQAINDGRNEATIALSEPESKKKVICSCGQKHAHGYDYEFADRYNPSKDWVDQYMERIAPALVQIEADAARKVSAWLETRSEPPAQDVFVDEVKKIIGDEFKKIDVGQVRGIVENEYRWYKATRKLSPQIEVAFGGADVGTVDFLASLDRFYLSKFIENPIVEKEMTEFLKKEWIEGGEGIYGRASAWAISEFQNRLASYFIKRSRGQVRMIVDTGVQRIRNWADVHQLHDAGLQKLVIIEPNPKRCEYCAAWNGREVSVPAAHAEMRKQAALSPKAYNDYLRHKDNAATLENVEAHISQGKIPPAHPYCYGYVTVA